MKEYIEWLRNIKGFTDKTIEIYGRYIFELLCSNEDYKLLLDKYTYTSNSTKRLILSACKSYYKFKKDERFLDIELPKIRHKVVDFITHEEYTNYLLKLNLKTKMGFQKYLIIRLLFETGIRSSEILQITKKDIFENKIKINGKGKKERYVLISTWLQNDVQRYIKNISSMRLFDFGYKNLYSKLQRLDKNKKITPHMFRRGYAKYCHQKNVSIYDISISMGHNSVDTTARYIDKKSDQIEIYKIFS